MKRDRPEGRKEPFGRSLFALLLRCKFLSALFLCYSYSFLAFFSLFRLFVARKGGRKGGEGEKRGWKNAHQKKIFAKVPVWWQEKPANRATFAAET
ncbi:hypothetical protein [Bacteroides thetaiotaomicron]|uniref:hypothetical protein n=1 Tax=Bacteroides thetaiotaomicron TaxID=818 RepID=UPI00216623B3|nr:hypothetical protein [Bacteroides thetaiotaomicron]MCS2294349.1 hypothetical protein [Bacteroides thetaiotaomicron]